MSHQLQRTDRPTSEYTLAAPPQSMIIPNYYVNKATVRMICHSLEALPLDSLKMVQERLTQLITKKSAEESKVSEAAQQILLPKTPRFSQDKTKRFQEEIRKPDGEAVKKWVADPEVDINQEIEVSLELPLQEQRRQSMFAPSISNSIPLAALAKREPQKRCITVSAVYYALYQYLVALTPTRAQKAAYHLIFLDLLRHPATDLNQRKKTPGNEEDAGFSILHLAVQKLTNMTGIVEAILDTKRAEINLPVEHISDKPNYHGYTALDLVLLKIEKPNQSPSESQAAVKVYKLLVAQGAKHEKKQVPPAVQKLLASQSSGRDTLRRGRPQSQFNLNGNGYHSST